MDFKSFFRGQVEGKAFPNHPMLSDGRDQQLPLVSTATNQRARTPFGQRSAARHLQAYGGRTDAIDWVMDCVGLITETASGADWHLEKDGVRLLNQKTPTSPPDLDEADQQLVKLLKQPNPYMDYEELIELLLIDWLLVGNAFVLKHQMYGNGKPLALYRLAPPYVEVIPGPFGVEGYRYNVPGQKEPLILDADQVVHFKRANPHDPYFGMGVIQGGARMLDLELALTDTQASYYEKHAQPSMIVESERRVPKDVFNKLKTQLKGMYGGSGNAGAMMVLEAGLKAQTISPSAIEAGFKEIANASRDRILTMFRVPGVLLGIQDVAAQSKINDAQRVFDTKTMRPLLNKLQKAITRGIVEAWDCDFRIDHDYIMPPEDRIKYAGTVAILPGIRVWQVLEAGGYERIGDPEIDEIVLNLPGDDGTEEDTGNGHPDNNLPGEAGRPPKPENTVAFPKTAAARLPKLGGSKADRKGVSVDDKLELLDEALWRAKLARAEGKAPSSGAVKLEPEGQTSEFILPEDSLLDAREQEIDLIVSDTIHGLGDAVHVLERSLLDHIEGKAFKPNDLKSRIRKSEAWATFSSMIGNVLEEAARRAASMGVLHQGRLGIRSEDEVDYDTLAREVVYRPEGVKNITRTLKESIAQRVSRGLEKDDATKADVEASVREALANWKTGKAETIALTEATEAYNEATLTVIENSGEATVAVFDGHDHDQPCIDADGSFWTISEARKRRTEHPRCRRAFGKPAAPEPATV